MLDTVTKYVTVNLKRNEMIKSFRHRGLKKLFTQGDASGIRADWVRKMEIRLAALDSTEKPEDLNVPGWRFHVLRGYRPMRYSIRVTGNYRITFAWDGGAIDVDLEDYH